MKKQRTTDAFAPETKTAAIEVTAGDLKFEAKKKPIEPTALLPVQVGDICQTAYYERKHTGKDADDPKWSEWQRTGTRFYRCTHIVTGRYAYMLTGEEDAAACRIENITASAGNQPFLSIDYSPTKNKWHLHSPSRTNQDDLFGPWKFVWAEEFEVWHKIRPDKPMLTPTQFAALYPKQSKPMHWPVIDIVLGYSNVDFKDVGFPRPVRRYDVSGPIPRLIGSLG